MARRTYCKTTGTDLHSGIKREMENDSKQFSRSSSQYPKQTESHSRVPVPCSKRLETISNQKQSCETDYMNKVNSFHSSDSLHSRNGKQTAPARYSRIPYTRACPQLRILPVPIEKAETRDAYSVVANPLKTGKVGSLCESPKWAKIKEKFENGNCSNEDKCEGSNDTSLSLALSRGSASITVHRNQQDKELVLNEAVRVSGIKGLRNARFQRQTPTRSSFPGPGISSPSLAAIRQDAAPQYHPEGRKAPSPNSSLATDCSNAPSRMPERSYGLSYIRNRNSAPVGTMQMTGVKLATVSRKEAVVRTRKEIHLARMTGVTSSMPQKTEEETAKCLEDHNKVIQSPARHMNPNVAARHGAVLEMDPEDFCAKEVDNKKGVCKNFISASQKVGGLCKNEATTSLKNSSKLNDLNGFVSSSLVAALTRKFNALSCNPHEGRKFTTRGRELALTSNYSTSVPSLLLGKERTRLSLASTDEQCSFSLMKSLSAGNLSVSQNKLSHTISDFTDSSCEDVEEYCNSNIRRGESGKLEDRNAYATSESEDGETSRLTGNRIVENGNHKASLVQQVVMNYELLSSPETARKSKVGATNLISNDRQQYKATVTRCRRNCANIVSSAANFRTFQISLQQNEPVTEGRPDSLAESYNYFCNSDFPMKSISSGEGSYVDSDGYSNGALSECGEYQNVPSVDKLLPKRERGIVLPRHRVPVPQPRRQLSSLDATSSPVYMNEILQGAGSGRIPEEPTHEQHGSMPRPNDSFLWSRARYANCDQGEENIYEDLLNYTSYPCRNLAWDHEEHVYSEASHTSDSLSSLSRGRSLEGSTDDDDRGSSVPYADGEEGWEDISDDDRTKDLPQKRPTTLNMKVKIKGKRGSQKNGLYNSRSLSRRGFECVTVDNNKKNEDSDEYQDLCIWDTVEADELPDNQYEPVYDTIGAVQNCGSDDANQHRSSLTSTDSGTSGASDSPDNPFSCRKILASPPVERSALGQTVLKRNTSLTKSDIRLELSSKLNKIKIRKNVHSATEIGVGFNMPEPVSAASTSKKKALIKCILRQKGHSVPKAATLSPKKETATFYVHWSGAGQATSGKGLIPIFNSGAKRGSLPDSGMRYFTGAGALDSQKCEQERVAVKKHMLVRRTSSAGSIRRPTTPPPLPPTSAGGRSSTPEIGHVLVPNPSQRCSRDGQINSTELLHNMHGIQRDSAIPDRQQQQCTKDSSHCCISNHNSVLNRKGSATFPSFPHLTEDFRRSSVASGDSVDSYIHADSVASVPKGSPLRPPLPLPINEDQVTNVKVERVREWSVALGRQRSYLQFQSSEPEMKSPFEEEPLYQFYQQDALQRATYWLRSDASSWDDDDSEYYETLPCCEQDPLKEDEGRVANQIYQSQLSAMDLVKEGGIQRSLWCEVAEVKSSGILEKISAQERKVQEAMFEVITSEASYLKSLNILMEHFVQCPQLTSEFSPNCVLKQHERQLLFADVLPVKETSERLLADLEKRWRENIVMSNVCDILYWHATKHFPVYVKYCSNQIHQDRVLKELKEGRSEFVEVLKRLESSPVCQGLSMYSFLMLPMQRITRLPLLVDAIFHRLPESSPCYESCKVTLATLNKLVADCNEGAKKMARVEEMVQISKQLDFKECKSLPLISSSRWLVKRGELIRLTFEVPGRRTFGRSSRCLKVPLYLFLFTDLLVVTKRKSDDLYQVLDYCPRNMVQVTLLESPEGGVQLPCRPPDNLKNLFQMSMLNNHEGKTVEMILSCILESDRTRWMEAVTPPVSDNPNERIYEEWDCPQIQCIHNYIAQQPDELSLEESDVVNVFRKMSDGWYEGERIRDGMRGWFPATHTIEIISSHVRARNLRQRYRLLVLSQTFLEKRRSVQNQQGKTK